MFIPRVTRPASVLILVLACLAGCGENEAKMSRRTVEIAKVPAPLLDAAKKELPGVDFTEAWSNHVPGAGCRSLLRDSWPEHRHGQDSRGPHRPRRHDP